MFSMKMVDNFILAKLDIPECMQWVFKVFSIYYLFSLDDYGSTEYIFHL